MSDRRKVLELFEEHKDVIDEKIQEDYKSVLVSEMEQFLSVFLYIDLKGKNWAMELNRFVNSFKKAYIADACFFKLSSYYYESNDLHQFYKLLSYLLVHKYQHHNQVNTYLQ